MGVCACVCVCLVCVYVCVFVPPGRHVLFPYSEISISDDFISILSLPTDHPITVPFTHGTDFTPVRDNHESRFWRRERSYRPITSFSAHLRNLRHRAPDASCSLPYPGQYPGVPGAASAGHFVTYNRISTRTPVVSKRPAGGAGCEAADRWLGGMIHTGIRRC